MWASGDLGRLGLWTGDGRGGRRDVERTTEKPKCI